MFSIYVSTASKWQWQILSLVHSHIPYICSLDNLQNCQGWIDWRMTLGSIIPEINICLQVTWHNYILNYQKPSSYKMYYKYINPNIFSNIVENYFFYFFLRASCSISSLKRLCQMCIKLSETTLGSIHKHSYV